MAARKNIKTMSIGGITGNLISATTGAGKTADVDEVACYGDGEFSAIPRPVLHNTDFAFEFLNEGEADFSGDAGTVKTVTLTCTYWDGASGTATQSVSVPMVIISATPNEVSVDGERKATVVVVARKHGPTASASQD